MDRLYRRISGALLCATLLCLSPIGFAQEQCTSATLEAADEFNALIFGDFTSTSSDTEGRLLVQGNLSLNHYSIAAMLDPETEDTSIVVGGDFDFPSGRIYAGDVVVGGTANLGDSVLFGLSPEQTVADQAELSIDFDQAKQQMLTLSTALSELAANGSFNFQYGGFQLYGDGVSELQVFDLDGVDVLSAHTFNVQDVPLGATLVFNISGQATGLTNMSLSSLEAHREGVVFNFYEADQLTLAGIGVEGSILAPNAVIQNPQGVIKGTVIAAAWDGMMQLNHNPFTGCFHGVSLGDDPQPNTAPIAAAQTLTATEDGSLNVLLLASDVDGDAISFTVVSQPSFGVLSGEAPALVYTPTADFNGTDTFSFVANDGALDSAIATVDIAVTAVNDAPVTNDSQTTVAEDAAVSVVLNATDIDGDSLSYLITLDPSNGSLSGTAPNVTYTANPDFFGADAFSYQVSDGQVQSVVATVAIAVSAVNDAPTSTAQQLSGLEDQSLSLTLTGNDIDSATLAYDILSAPTSGSLSGLAPDLVYTPNQDVNGSDQFTYQVSDGQLSSAPVVVSIAVSAVNDAPVATPVAPISTPQDLAVAVILSGTDIDGDTLDVLIVAAPSNGQLSGNDGNLTYTPDTGFVGQDTFSYQVSDGTASSDPVVVAITVTDVNDAPTASDLNATGDEDIALTIVLLGSDPEGQLLTYTVLNQPLNGVVTGTDSALTYTPNDNYYGSDSFDYQVSDGELDSNIATVNIVVNAINDIAVATSQQLAAEAGQPLAITLSASDIDGDALTYEVVSGPTGGTLSGVAPDLTYTAPLSFVGLDQFDIVANDGVINSAPATIQIQVSAPNQAPSVVSQPVTQAATAASYQTDVDATDPENAALEYSLGIAPTGMSIDSTTGVVSWSVPQDYTLGILDSDSECQVPVETSGAIEPVVKWRREDFTSLSPPAVVPLADSNGDGLIDEDDDLAIVVVGNRKLFALDAETGQTIWQVDSSSAGGFDNTTAISAADLDGDGDLEFLVGVRTNWTLLAAFDHQGNELWIHGSASADQIGRGAAIFVADIDTDGQLEIFASDKVFNANGELLSTLSIDRGFGNPLNVGGNNPLVADIDLDGVPELLSGRAAHDLSGNQLWFHSSTGNTYGLDHRTALANLDADPAHEVIIIGSGVITLVDDDGTLIFRSEANKYISQFGFQGGAPVVADFDFDGLSEFVIAGGESMVMFDTDGTDVWEIPISDRSSQKNGILAVDLNGDGFLELLYSDETDFMIIDPIAGEVLYRDMDHRSGTLFEFPIAVDLDHDGATEIITVGSGSSVTAGVRVYESAQDNWAATSAIWQQPNQWPGYFENFRPTGANPALGEFRVAPTQRTLLPDLAVQQLSIDAEQSLVEVTIVNRGAATVAQLSTVSLWLGSPLAGGIELAQASLPQLASDQSATLTFTATVEQLTQDLFVQVDIDQVVAECHETNNLVSFPLVSVVATDPQGLADTQTYAINVTETNDAPVLVDATMADGRAREKYNHLFAVDDPDLGDSVQFEIVSGPAGARLDATSGLLSWIPSDAAQGLHTFTIRVTDLAGLSSERTFNTIEVLEGGPPPLGANFRPIITSSPQPLDASAGIYVYDVDAEDPNDDPLTYTLTRSPDGMTIDPATGLIEWPLTQSGGVSVTILVTDGRGGEVGQAFSLNVPVLNTSPTITSEAVLLASTGVLYQYDVDATDAQNDAITYSLGSAPTGMTIDPTTGLIQWTPPLGQVGAVEVEAIATDAPGLASVQTFTISVTDDNQIPSITSLPPSSQVVADVLFSYDVDASDPDGDTLTFSLITPPAGMVIDPSTGLIEWTPSLSQAGDYIVSIEAADGRGGVATQDFALSVLASANMAPSIDSLPGATAKATFEYLYQVVASDANGDALNYSLTEGPADAVISADGLLSWTPTTAGAQDFTVQVDDGSLFVTQSWTVTVLDAATELQLALSIDPLSAEIGELVAFTLVPAGASGDVTLTLTVDGVDIPVEQNGQASLTANTVGQFDVQATVTDAYGTANTSGTFTVTDPTNTSDFPVVQIVSPDGGTDITAPTDVVAAIDDDNLLSWFLALQENGAAPGEFSIIAEGTNTTPAATIAELDPTMLLNGQYTLILQAEDASGNIGTDSVTVLLDGDLKVGHFSITFEDLSVPMAGLPISVTRTYDTRRRHESLDFGFGWSVDYQNLRIHESRTPGFAWQLTQKATGPFGALTEFCVESALGNTVSITMPDGEVEKFEPVASPQCNTASPILDVSLSFEPVNSDNGATLEALDGNFGRLINGSLADPGDPNSPINPQRYKLITEDGMEFILDQGFTIREVTEPAFDNTLTFGDDGILHSAGESVTFVRDTENRITQVIAPDNTTLNYEYNAGGDLIAFTDQVGNRTEYTYLANPNVPPHYLEDIIDPRGIRVARNEYDDDGRLIAHIDAEGHRIEYTHDIQGRVETVRDRNGNATTYVYNDRGDVLAETNAEGETIIRTYDSVGNELSRTDDLGNTTSWTYDRLGNQLTETDPLGNVTTSTYGPFNQFESQVDALGNTVMRNTYLNQTVGGVVVRPGPLRRVIDAINNNSIFTYAPNGTVERITDALGQNTLLDTDSRGFTIGTVDVRGVRTDYTVDDLGRRLTETTTRTDENGVVQTIASSFGYDAKGQLLTTIDGLGNVSQTEYNGIYKAVADIDALDRRTEYEYDDRGNRVLTRYPDLTTETMVYDPAGNVVEQTDRLGRTTKMVYDRVNRLIETIYPDATPADDGDNPRSRSEYDDAGRMIASINERGQRTEYDYDDASRRVLVRDALNQENRSEYDGRGMRTAAIDALGRRTEFVYDDASRLIETVYPDQTPANTSDNLRTSTVYDGLGRKVSETDMDGKVTQFEYDSIGNLIAVIDALNQRTEYDYDEQNNKIVQRDATGNETRWAYDNLGRVISRTLPGGQLETYGYNAIGNRISRTDFNGQTTTYAYDNLNRMVRTDYPDGTSVVNTYTITGQIDTMTDYRGVTDYDYDERERLIRITYPTSQIIEYGYDAVGNRTELITANQSVAYTFDGLNRLSTVTDATGTATYAYDLVGNRAGMVNANGTTVTYVYDTLNRLTDLVNADPLGNPISEHHYTLGNAGNRTRLEETLAPVGAPTATERVVDYVYDDLYRLESETVTDATNGNRTTSWTYDATGNRLTQTDLVEATSVATTYVYDVNDRLESETEGTTVTTYVYDANGNTLTKAEDGIVTTTYAYDFENRLIDLNNGETTYTYEPGNIRQSQTTTDGTTSYLVDPNRDYAQVIEEIAQGQIIPEMVYTYGDDLINQQPLVGNVSTFHYDGLGSTRALTDAAASSTDSYVYTAFGETEVQEGSTPNLYLYTGEQFDPNVGFYYLRARYYNASVGRFQTMDTFFGIDSDPRSLHKYLYVYADPINLADYSGNSPLTERTFVAEIQGIFAGQVTGAAGRRLVYKAGCFAIEYYAVDVVTSGIYFFVADIGKVAGKPYVGQSVNTVTRIKQHVGQKISQAGKLLKAIPVIASNPAELKEALDLVEQWALDILEDEFGPKKQGVANQKNVIGKKRKGLLEKLKKVKLCK